MIPYAGVATVFLHTIRHFLFRIEFYLLLVLMY